MHANPERDLWCSVIQQALTDATSYPRNVIARKEADRTREWFIRNGNDFHHVCQLAGIEPDSVRKIALETIEKTAPGVVENFHQAPRDRCGSIAHDFPKIEIFP